MWQTITSLSRSKASDISSRTGEATVLYKVLFLNVLGKVKMQKSKWPKLALCLPRRSSQRREQRSNVLRRQSRLLGTGVSATLIPLVQIKTQTFENSLSQHFCQMSFHLTVVKYFCTSRRSNSLGFPHFKVKCQKFKLFHKSVFLPSTGTIGRYTGIRSVTGTSITSNYFPYYKSA